MNNAVPVEPIRLLKVVPTLLCGGTENQVMTLSRSLDSTRFALELGCLRRLGPFIAELDERQIPLSEYSFPGFRSVRAFSQQARLASYIARHRIQIVHSYNFYGNVFAIPPARLAGAPVVIASIRDRGPYLTPMQKRVQRYACRLANRVLVNANAVKEWLVDQGYDATKIVVIRNGVDLSRFGSAVNPDAVGASLGLPPDTLMVTVVSRLSRLKGLEHFLEAAAILAPRFPRLYFLIVGETAITNPQYLTSLKEFAQRLGIAGRVVFTGLRSDIPALLASATVSVMPSLNEALSNVLLESMAAGAPTVATRVGGTPEAMTHGVTGLLIPPGDSLALAESIARLVNDRTMATAFGRAARQTILEQFSIERMVQTTEQLYADLLAERQSQRATAPWLIRASSRPIRRPQGMESR